MQKFSIIASLISIGLSTAAGAQTQTNEYSGASFNEVWSVVSDQNFSPRTEEENTEYKIYHEGSLPQYPVSAASIFKNGKQELERDAVRTVNERFDYYDRLPKKLHPNGVCVAGEWQIDAKTPYSGM
ncbi:MAG: hypothetical protein ACXVB1_18960, partial [Pseudobdellovibrionaceae bacterium]